MMTICEKIKAARKELDMTQKALAMATGISKRSIAKYETCTAIQIRDKNLHLLAEALNVSYDYLTIDEITDPHTVL